MGKKQHPLVRKLWSHLKELISPIPENNFEELLVCLKIWINSHPILLKNIHSDFTVLCLFLNGNNTQFHFVKSTAGNFLKSIINNDLYSPKEIKDIIEFLELILRQFALFTNWETCPICQEGYFEYWKDININEIVLSCSECGYEKYLHQEVNEENLRIAILLPADKKDIKMLKLSIL